jgi:Na+-transporting NADH:ubiquinone oxidoreductase subunit A
LDLPITGQPEQVVSDAPAPRFVALLGDDYVGMKPTMHVQPGDRVQRGQLIFEDKKIEGVRFTAPGGGTVVDVYRGDRRRFEALVIELDEAERKDPGKAPCVTFEAYSGKEPQVLGRQGVQDLLLESGLWTALRARPFDRTANPADNPHSVVINAMDSNPLAPNPSVVLEGRGEDFARGVAAVAQLTEGTTYVCKAPATVLEGLGTIDRVQVEEFAGPHPAGTSGYQIHVLDPVDRQKVVWYLGYQDVLAIGRLFATGRLDVERVVAVAGPPVKSPRLLRTRLGADTATLTAGEIPPEGEYRVITGSVLSGRRAEGENFGYLGRFHNQISVLEEDRERRMLGWLAPGADKFSVVRAFVSSLFPSKKYDFTTSTNGSPRAIVPIGMYEQVMPMDILPTFLLRALMVGDLERAEELGALELAEEDLALCTFVCPGKNDYGPALRRVLTTLEKEG